MDIRNHKLQGEMELKAALTFGRVPLEGRGAYPFRRVEEPDFLSITATS